MNYYKLKDGGSVGCIISGVFYMAKIFTEDCIAIKEIKGLSHEDFIC